VEGIRCRDLNVGFNAGSFPICFRYGVDGPGKRHANHEVIIDPMSRYRVGSADGGLPHKRGAFQILEVVAEFLAPEKIWFAVKT